MAYDTGLAQLMEDDLADQTGITSRKMFGGLCFMLHGNMVCGVHKDGGMYRVGKPHQEAALAIPGARPLDFTGRPMGGMISVDEDLLADDDRRLALLKLSLDHAHSLPPK